MYDQILLPTDGSAGMERVVEHAGDLAAEQDALLYAMYVIDPTGFNSLPMETSWEGIADLLREEAATALDEVERRVGERAPIERVVIEGTPSEEIVEYASDYDVDLILMGTHGRGGIDRWLLGSVAERVVRRSQVPVTTIRVRPADSPAPIE